MKKWLIICFGVVFVAQSVFAGTCIGGKEYVGRNGHSYCISNRGMNWWSAYQWCEAQGRRFATPSEACDYNGEAWGSGYCSNLVVGSELSSQWGWLNLGLSASRSLIILFGNKALFSTTTQNDKNQANLAICY